MVNKALRIVLYSIFTISLLFVVPFNIYADTISASNIVGVNVELVGSSLLEHRTETVQTNTYNYYLNQYTYKAIIELDNSYVGVIGARVQGNYYDKAPSQGSTVRTESLNHYRKIYVNGNTAEMTFVITSWISSYDDPLIYRADGTSPSVTIEDSNVTKFEDIDSIEQIIDILSDIYQNSTDIEGLSTNQLTELQNIVANTSLANQYLEDISLLRQWNFPIESLNSVLYVNNYNDIIDMFDLGYWKYPVFDVKANNYIFQNKSVNVKDNYVFIYVGKTNSLSHFNNRFSLTNLNVVSFEILDTIGYIAIDNDWFVGCKVVLKPTSSPISISSLLNQKFIPIYFGAQSSKNISTDFALNYGLSNTLLDNIQLIANGTNASSAASSQSDQANSQLQQDSNTLFSQEDSFKQNMNSAMQNIDTTFTLNNFGSSFITSAQWVRTQYETLTNNTPFASLITFSLLVGLALIVIGKVYK